MNNELNIKLLNRIRVYIWIIIIGLALSGITAFPIETELAIAVNHQSAHPVLSCGTDWLAFAHLMLAVLFIGPLRDPVKNKWIIKFGIIAAVMIFPLAFIAGGIRGIPVFWRLIDCSFGVVALVVLVPCYRMIGKLSIGL